MEIVKHVVSKARKREDGQWEYKVVCIQCSLHFMCASELRFTNLIQSLSLCVIQHEEDKPGGRVQSHDKMERIHSSLFGFDPLGNTKLLMIRPGRRQCGQQTVRIFAC
jgi:hypothetical protein